MSAILLAPSARACSPDFPNSLIENDSVVLAAPSADFLYELNQIPSPRTVAFRYVKRTTTEAELDDLGEALKGRPDRERILGEYQEVRKQLDAFVDPPSYRGSAPLLPEKPLEVTIPARLPEEFLRYARGAVFYHNGKIARAISAWRNVLDLPEGQRRYRTVWATFMIGRALMDDNPNEAIRQFEQVRRLVQQGFPDSLGLAALSYGWQGRIELDRAHDVAATDCYLMQLACGDPLAAWSLRDAACDVFSAGPAALKEAAMDPNARRVVTAYLVALPRLRWGGPQLNTNQILQWLAAVEACKIANLDGADRLAWIAYQANLYVEADHWLNRGVMTPLGHWVRAKLLLRSGQLTAAAEHLAEAQRGFPAELAWSDSELGPDASSFRLAQSIGGEIGALHLAQKQYVQALDELLQNDFWQDAAYIAERVLTADELLHYVDDKWPADKPGGDRIRALLARRLMRLGRGDEALPYFDRPSGVLAVQYYAALCDGRDLAQSDTERAESLWLAASIARANGMELFGTELDPDSAIYGGGFTVGLVHARLNTNIPSVIAPSADETARATRSFLTPARRFHYRYLAADLAWEAIALMPDNDETGAARLYEAGGWIKGQDAPSADRFYKELVTRFSQTALGIEATKLHWFPKQQAR